MLFNYCNQCYIFIIYYLNIFDNEILKLKIYQFYTSGK